MAKLDSAIERLYREAGLELVLQSNAVPFVRVHTGMRQVLKGALNTAQIVAAVSEILPAHLRGTFPRDGTTRFSYGEGARAVQVRFDKWGDRVRSAITPNPGGEEPAEAGALAVVEEARDDVRTEPKTDGPSMPIPKGHPAYSEPPPVEAPSFGPALTVIGLAKPPEPPRLIAPAADPSGQMAELLALMLERRASDLHLTSGKPPMFRIDGEMVLQDGYPALSAARLRELLWSITPEKNRAQFDETRDTDFAHETDEGALPREPLRRPPRDRRGAPADPEPDPDRARSSASPQAILDLCYLSQGARARHRPDRLGQVDDARGDDRPHQPQPAPTTSSPSRTRSSSCTRTSSAS